MTARFFGLDPAWKDGNPSGVSALDRHGSVVDEDTVDGDDEMVAWVADRLHGPAVIGADIPLRVPNETGARPCDRAVTSAYGARKAGPHPANRTLFLGRFGRIRGEDLAGRFAALGFADPWSGGDRVILEVYPHPGHVEVFSLPERLTYKKGTLAQRRAGLHRLRRRLESLEHADPPLRGPRMRIPRHATGAMLKSIEDRLDARFCAWVASVWGAYGPDGVLLFGDADQGHIAVPRPPITG